MSNQEFQEEIINIVGMHCKSCAEGIETKLLQLNGVDKVRVSLVEEKAYIRFDPSLITIEKIKEKIREIGYDTGNDTKNTGKNSIKQGIVYGIIPHIGCIVFIIASILGVTVATEIFKPLLLNPYFFYILILLSLLFATISAIFYFKRQGFINFVRDKGNLEVHILPEGIRGKWKYLLTMYGSTIGINLFLFMIVFPLLTNVSLASPTITGYSIIPGTNNLSLIKLKVDIPCSGHASLISQELKSIGGVIEVKFSFPNVFDVKYDPVRTSKQQILSLKVFDTYKATVLNESDILIESSNLQKTQESNDQQIKGSCCGGSGCSGTCGCGAK